jgi:hypothetical protein
MAQAIGILKFFDTAIPQCTSVSPNAATGKDFAVVLRENAIRKDKAMVEGITSVTNKIKDESVPNKISALHDVDSLNDSGQAGAAAGKNLPDPKSEISELVTVDLQRQKNKPTGNRVTVNLETQGKRPSVVLPSKIVDSPPPNENREVLLSPTLNIGIVLRKLAKHAEGERPTTETKEAVPTQAETPSEGFRRESEFGKIRSAETVNLGPQARGPKTIAKTEQSNQSHTEIRKSTSNLKATTTVDDLASCAVAMATDILQICVPEDTPTAQTTKLYPGPNEEASISLLATKLTLSTANSLSVDKTRVEPSSEREPEARVLENPSTVFALGPNLSTHAAELVVTPGIQTVAEPGLDPSLALTMTHRIMAGSGDLPSLTSKIPFNHNIVDEAMLGQPANSGYLTAGNGSQYSLLSATPTAVEVGISSGGLGWIKIRAELTGSGDISASLIGTSSVALVKLENDLPKLISYLQAEKIQLSGLAVHVASPIIVLASLTELSSARQISQLSDGLSSFNGSSNNNGSANDRQQPSQLEEEQAINPEASLPYPLQPLSITMHDMPRRTETNISLGTIGHWLNVRA